MDEEAGVDEAAGVAGVESVEGVDEGAGGEAVAGVAGVAGWREDEAAAGVEGVEGVAGVEGGREDEVVDPGAGVEGAVVGPVGERRRSFEEEEDLLTVWSRLVSVRTYWPPPETEQ